LSENLKRENKKIENDNKRQKKDKLKEKVN